MRGEETKHGKQQFGCRCADRAHIGGRAGRSRHSPCGRRIALIAKDECFRTENETELKTKRLNDAAQEKSRTNAALDSRKYALKVKRALIDEAFALAAERMEQKSDAERSALIKALLIREAEGGETIIPAARDEANVKSVLAEANAALAESGRAPLTIAPADADITGGFILKAAGYEKNCSFAAVLREVRAAEESAVAQILFE